MSLTESYIQIATDAAREHTSDELDVAKILTATTMELFQSGSRLPGAMAVVIEAIDTVRVNRDGQLHVVDRNSRPRYGANGLLTVAERIAELKADAKFRRAWTDKY